MELCRRHFTLLVCLALGPALSEQGPAALVADLETTVVPGGPLEPYGFTEMGGCSYFGAWDEQHGYELWRTDGTESGTQLLTDLQPGPVGSVPMNFVVVGSTLFFTATDGSGFGLWKTDGTATGTTLVKGARRRLHRPRPRHHLRPPRRHHQPLRARSWSSAYTPRSTPSPPPRASSTRG